MNSRYKVEQSKIYPGFYFIVQRITFMFDDNYLHKDGKIYDGYGKENETPEEMNGLWNNEEKARQFLDAFNNVADQIC